MKRQDEGPHGEDGKLAVCVEVKLSPEEVPAQIIGRAFEAKYQKMMKDSIPAEITWESLRKYLKPFIPRIRRARREIERRHRINLPAGCLAMKVRRGQDPQSPVVAEVDEKRVYLYKRA